MGALGLEGGDWVCESEEARGEFTFESEREG